MQVCLSGKDRIGLRRLLPDAEFTGADDVGVNSCASDSRQIRPGDLFAAFRGTSDDGHDHIDEALARGCSAILSERAVPEAPVPVCIVPDAREAYGRLCQMLAGHPSRRMKVIGVTGTNGKTTTCCLIAGVLKAAGFDLGMTSTLGYSDGRRIADAALTTPPAEQLAQWLARSEENGCSHAVVEVSSHGLDQSRLAGVEIDTACITNVRRDHLDYHHRLADYRRSKAKLLSHLSHQGLAVLNADDPVSAAWLPRVAGPALTVAMHAPAEITATVLERFASEQTFLLSAGSHSVPVRTRIIGDAHVSNCLIAAAVGLAHEIDLTTVVRGLESIDYVPGRLERMEYGQPFGVFVDYAHTPDALAASLRTLGEVTQGKLICVFGAGGDRDAAKRPLMGRAVEQAADAVIVTNDNPRSEDPGAIAGDLTGGMEHPDRADVCLDRAKAIRRALNIARPGDCVLIAGKGHETHQVVEDRRIPFCDAAAAREWLLTVGKAVYGNVQ